MSVVLVPASKRSPQLRHYYRNKEKILSQKKKRYSTEKRYGVHLKKVYGITLEQYNEMYKAQGGRCLICERHRDELLHKLRVDHDHELGIVRGLLCQHCNSLIGYVPGRIDKPWYML